MAEKIHKKVDWTKSEREKCSVFKREEFEKENNDVDSQFPQSEDKTSEIEGVKSLTITSFSAQVKI